MAWHRKKNGIRELSWLDSWDQFLCSRELRIAKGGFRSNVFSAGFYRTPSYIPITSRIFFSSRFAVFPEAFDVKGKGIRKSIETCFVVARVFLEQRCAMESFFRSGSWRWTSPRAAKAIASTRSCWQRIIDTARCCHRKMVQRCWQ